MPYQTLFPKLETSGDSGAEREKEGTGRMEKAGQAATGGLPRPRLLMVSHCVPAPEGAPDRTRTWRLLQTAASTHDVWLIAVASHRASLQDWHRLNRATSTFTLVPPPPMGSVRRACERTAHTWCVRTRFDCVLCTHSDLWAAAAQIEARQRFCENWMDRSLGWIRTVAGNWFAPAALTPPDVLLLQAPAPALAGRQAVEVVAPGEEWALQRLLSPVTRDQVGGPLAAASRQASSGGTFRQAA